MKNYATVVQRKFVAILWIGVFMVQIVQADDLAGADDPALLSAISVWLQDNDEDSLPEIAALAGSGNIAARLLIAQIEITDRAPSAFIHSLSRNERVELFRSTSGKGVFRPSWLKQEMQAGNQIAAALLKAPALEVNIEAIKSLYVAGEPEATYDLVRQVAGNGTKEQKQELSAFLPETSELAPYLRALQTPVSGFTPGIAALQQIMGGVEYEQLEEILQGPEHDTSNAAEFVEFGYQNGVQSVNFDTGNSYYFDLASWIETSPLTAPIATVCNRNCESASVHSCAITAFGLVGGYYKAIRFDSPMESLIDQSTYATSNRAAGMLLRRISLVENASGNPLISDIALREKSECLAAPVAEVRAQRN
jgi:hypothetical protein